MEPIGRDFYKRHTVQVAKELLGKLLIRRIGAYTLSGKIVETEAYCSKDPASHSYHGMTERNKVMFGDVGHAYVYFTYSNHFCLNVVAKDSDPAGAVLIRAIEPLKGVEMMKGFRKTDDVNNLTTGPGKLTKALNIDKRLNGADMTKAGELFIAENSNKEKIKIKATRRIGIKLATNKMWRFVIEGNEFISK